MMGGGMDGVLFLRLYMSALYYRVTVFCKPKHEAIHDGWGILLPARRERRVRADQLQRVAGQRLARFYPRPRRCAARVWQRHHVARVPGVARAELPPDDLRQRRGRQELHDGQPSDGDHQFGPQQRELRAQIAAVKRGDRVVTSGGILGTVAKVRDGIGEVEVDIAPNVRVVVLRDTLTAIVAPVAANDGKPA